MDASESMKSPWQGSPFTRRLHPKLHFLHTVSKCLQSACYALALNATVLRPPQVSSAHGDTGDGPGAEDVKAIFCRSLCLGANCWPARGGEGGARSRKTEQGVRLPSLQYLGVRRSGASFSLQCLGPPFLNLLSGRCRCSPEGELFGSS